MISGTFFALLLFGQSDAPLFFLLFFAKKMSICQPFVESQSLLTISQIIVAMAYRIIAFRLQTIAFFLSCQGNS